MTVGDLLIGVTTGILQAHEMAGATWSYPIARKKFETAVARTHRSRTTATMPVRYVVMKNGTPSYLVTRFGRASACEEPAPHRYNNDREHYRDANETPRNTGGGNIVNKEVRRTYVVRVG